jgi:hypothetical protein
MQKKNIFSLGLLAIFVCLLFVGYHEFRMFPDYWHIRFGMPASFLYLLAAAALVILRLGSESKIISLSSKVTNLTFASTITLLVIGCYLTIKEIVLGTNYAFLEFHILSDELLYFGLLLFGFYLLATPVAHVRKNSPLLLFFLPIVMYAGMLFLFLENRVLFEAVTAEDSLFEYATAVFFFLSGFGLFWLQRHVSNTALKMLLVAGAVGLVVIAGEEISWAQRLIGIETPEVIAEHNMQNELTLHNLSYIYGYVVPAYILIGLTAGLLAPSFRVIVAKLQKNWSTFTIWVPGFITSIYFLQLSVQRYFTREFRIASLKVIEDWDLVIWNEFSETLAALGVLVFVGLLIYQNKKQLTALKNH